MVSRMPADPWRLTRAVKPKQGVWREGGRGFNVGLGGMGRGGQTRAVTEWRRVGMSQEEGGIAGGAWSIPIPLPDLIPQFGLVPVQVDP